MDFVPLLVLLPFLAEGIDERRVDCGDSGMDSIVKRVQSLLMASGRRRQPARQGRGIPARDGERGEASHTSAIVAGQPAQVLHPTVMMIMMDSESNRSLAQAFRGIGYEVRSVQELSEAVKSLSTEQPACIIVSSPSGPQACEILRRSTPAPILALLSQAEDTEVLATLDAGADDCQLASIGTDEIVLRARAILRRKHQTSLSR